PDADDRARRAGRLRRRAAAVVPRRGAHVVTGGVIDLSWWQLGLALALVALVAAVSLRQALGLERDLAIGALRTIVQLYAVGLILAAVFAAARWYWVLLILAAMMLIATQAAVSRLPKPLPGAYGIAGRRSR